MDEPKTTKRPKPGEDESEILRQMKDFESSKSSISAGNVVNFQKNKKPVSKFAQQRKSVQGQEKTEKKNSQENILKSVIQEKEFDYDQFTAQIMKIQKLAETKAMPFPNVMKLDSIVPSEKGQSLFSQIAIQSTEDEDCSCCLSNIQLESKVNFACLFWLVENHENIPEESAI